MRTNKKVCVVGGGYWGKNHLRTLNDLKRLGGLVEPNDSLQSKYKKLYPNISIYNCVEDVLSKDKYKIFTVATPAQTHFEIAKKIISAGNHVLVEKPFTLDIDHAVELVNLSKKNQISLQVGHLMLFHPAIKKIKTLIGSGKIGRLKYIYSNRINFGKVRTNENVFWSLAPHDISIFQYFTENFPKHINCSGSIMLQEGICDSVITQLKYPKGIDGHIFVSWLHPFKEHRIVVIGSEGMIAFDDADKNQFLKFYPRKVTILNGDIEKKEDPYELIKIDNKMPLTEQFSYFIEHTKNSNPLIANGDHALDVMKILVNASEQLKKN